MITASLGSEHRMLESAVFNLRYQRVDSEVMREVSIDRDGPDLQASSLELRQIRRSDLGCQMELEKRLSPLQRAV